MGPSDSLSPSAASLGSLPGLPWSADFAAGRGGSRQLTSHALVAVLPLRPRRRVPSKPEEDGTCCLRPQLAGSAYRICFCRGHVCVYSRCGPETRLPPPKRLCRWASAHSVSLLAAIQATGFLVLSPVGLSPTERASLLVVQADEALVNFGASQLIPSVGLTMAGAIERTAKPRRRCCDRRPVATCVRLRYCEPQ